MPTIVRTSNELCKWTPTNRLFHARAFKSSKTRIQSEVLAHKLAYTKEEKKQGKKMTLKYGVTIKPSTEEMNEIIKAHIHTEGLPFSSKEFEAFYTYAVESYEEYKNPIEALKFAMLVRDSTSNFEDQNMGTFVKNMQDFAVETYEALASSYKKYNDEEKFHSDVIDRLKSETVTRAYLPLAIELAHTTYDYSDCAELATKLFDEEDIVFELYKKALKSPRTATLNVRLEMDIKESNLNDSQKNELLIKLKHS